MTHFIDYDKFNNIIKNNKKVLFICQRRSGKTSFIINNITPTYNTYYYTLHNRYCTYLKDELMKKYGSDKWCNVFTSTYYMDDQIEKKRLLIHKENVPEISLQNYEKDIDIVNCEHYLKHLSIKPEIICLDEALFLNEALVKCVSEYDCKVIAMSSINKNDDELKNFMQKNGFIIIEEKDIISTKRSPIIMNFISDKNFL